jgi:hypothetical protein
MRLMTYTIAYVGNFESEWSTENDVRKAFEHMGHAVVGVQENKSNLKTLQTLAHSADLLLWTSTWDDSFDPVAVRDLVHDLAKGGIPSATYHLDSFWATNRGGRRWWLNPMFMMGHVFTADGDHERQWANLGVRHRWLRPGVRHDACHAGEPRDEFVCDVAVVGSNGHGYHEDVWPYRRKLVDTLIGMCKRNGWSWRNPGGTPKTKVLRNDDVNDFYASAKVTIGDSLCPLKDGSHYWSDRAYEGPGRGGMLVMPQIDALQEDYEGHMVMYPWDDFAALEDVIAYLLEDEAYRWKVQSANHDVAKRDHTYVNRMTTMLEEVMP